MSVQNERYPVAKPINLAEGSSVGSVWLMRVAMAQSSRSPSRRCKRRGNLDV